MWNIDPLLTQIQVYPARLHTYDRFYSRPSDVLNLGDNKIVMWKGVPVGELCKYTIYYVRKDCGLGLYGTPHKVLLYCMRAWTSTVLRAAKLKHFLKSVSEINRTTVAGSGPLAMHDLASLMSSHSTSIPYNIGTVHKHSHIRFRNAKWKGDRQLTTGLWASLPTGFSVNTTTCAGRQTCLWPFLYANSCICAMDSVDTDSAWQTDFTCCKSQKNTHLTAGKWVEDV